MAFAVGAGLSLLQFSQKRGAADIERRESETQALQANVGATQREAARKDRLARAMASQIASSGSRGVAAFEGSPLSILEADMAAAETAQERDTFQTELEGMTGRARVGIKERSKKQAATIGLIGDTMKLADTLPARKKAAA